MAPLLASAGMRVLSAIYSIRVPHWVMFTVLALVLVLAAAAAVVLAVVMFRRRQGR